MTLAANVAHGLGHGLIGAAVAAWRALALVGSYELLMMIIRSAQVPGAATAPRSAPARRPGVDPLKAQAAQEFAGEVAAGRVPSVRAIRARLHVGQSRAQRMRAYLAALNGTQQAGPSDIRLPSQELRRPPDGTTRPTARNIRLIARIEIGFPRILLSLITGMTGTGHLDDHGLR